MITVRLFGLIGIENNISLLNMGAGKVSWILDEVVRQCPGINREKLQQSVMFINKEQVNAYKVLSRTLKDGDELVLISPSSGG
ncbi:MAG TPA: MoaD/ThiS family protein [Negativicutes bacterium]|nr:MoaD/ThiS family protein [Negativicutes bacterium]